MDHIIIGGVAGGMSAATRLRRLDEDARITVIERSGHVSFANCGLPYHVGGVIEDRESLLLQTPASLGRRFGLDVRVGTEAVRIDRERRVVVVRELATGAVSELPYDQVLLSPGARPVRPPIPGIERALSLRDIEDTDALVTASAPARTAVIIGGGFIGLELAENLTRRGIAVTVVEAADQVMAPLDPEMVAPVQDHLRANGVALRLGASVTAIGPDSVTLSSGEQLEADLVVAAVGVRPDTRLAEDAGLETGRLGGILVDSRFRTSDPRILAVGDAVEKRDALDGEQVLVPLANTANRQGRMAADVMAGLSAHDRPVLGTAIVGIFGLRVATTGWNEKRLVAAGRPHRVVHTHPSSHATYYPGAEEMSLKLLVDRDTDAILGAQGVGREGVDKRIDVIATAIAGGITASALADLELAYAPQFGSAKDPVNLLGYVAGNLRTGVTRSLQWHELDDALAAGAVLVDVRTAEEHAAGAIPGALLVPVDELRQRLDEIPPGPVVVHCEVGQRGHTAAQVLTHAGREARNLDGGYRTWHAGTSARKLVPVG
ncbi:FAD-dependent oxidoreductase [Terrabacter carboxydivorans]|uniref:FAD-dependent oxidoreductase n=1 Tax=Terrabacter carboxydivorans TaxID=619730 RepID=A0ABP5Y382_9MICO